MRRFQQRVFVYSLLCITSIVVFADVPGVLAQPVLAPDTTKREFTEFMTKRLPAINAPASKEAWDQESAKIRKAMLDQVIFRGVPESWYAGPVRVEWVSDIETDKGYRIRKLRYEGAPGMWIPALLYEPTQMSGKVSAVLSVNGHTSTGKTNEEEQIRSIVLAKRGVIALHPEWIAFGELNHEDNRTHNNLATMNLCGVSGMSAFYLAMKRGLDVLMEYPAVDTNRVAMTGLSGGGWQTIILSSLDPRIAVSVPNAGYSGIDMRVAYQSDIGDLEQIPPDLLTIADFSHLTALLAPRPTLLIYNAKDECCFKADHMAPSVFDPVKPFFALYDRADAFRMYVNEDPGTHNYAHDNRMQLYAHLSTNFGLGWDDTEPSWEGEIRTADELNVGIPQSNATLVTLAEQFLDACPVNPAPKDGGIALTKWQEEAKERLRNVIKLKEIGGAPSQKWSDSTADGFHIATYELQTGEFSVPAVLIEPEGKAETTTVLFGDKGKGALVETATKLAGSGSRVIAIDLFQQGECRLGGDNHYQYGALVETAGGRMLGINVTQLGSVVAWARREFKAPVAIHSYGSVSGVIALIYGGLHRTELHRLTNEDALTSLKNLITGRMKYNDYYPLYCFGLLKEFDVPDLVALCQGMQVNVERNNG
ncbi:MAG: acetylxylan esterase [Candidatus Hydrogenedentes bacterium]|nr:acetylxylan esterase [Candidatus Hydrogenedentota bacterium]